MFCLIISRNMILFSQVEEVRRMDPLQLLNYHEYPSKETDEDDPSVGRLCSLHEMGHTSLHLAVLSDSLEMCRAVSRRPGVGRGLAAKANAQGQTPLSLAVRYRKRRSEICSYT